MMKSLLHKTIRVVLAALFLVTGALPPDSARAQAVPSSNLLWLSKPYSPAIVRGLSIYPDAPLKFDFIIDTGDDNLAGDVFQKESEKLIKYFLAALAVPEKELWVNLSPYEKDRVVPDGLGRTGMGLDMLAQDQLLKKMTASLLHPDSESGKKFWIQVYEKAQAQFGTTNIPIDTFNKVWITPDKAAVYEKDNRVFVAERHLKVMLESDYVAFEQSKVKSQKSKEEAQEAFDLRLSTSDQKNPSKDLAKQVLREIVLPELENEVNTGKNFAPLRQIYNSLILASWYKKKLRDSLLGQVYFDSNKTGGVDSGDLFGKDRIYQEYLETFRKGVFDLIREDHDPVSGETIPRKYFSGGLTVGAAGVKDLRILTGDMAQLPSLMRDFVVRPESFSGKDQRVIWELVDHAQKPDSAQALTILDAREQAPFQPVNPVADFTAREFPDIKVAERRSTLPLMVELSDDMTTLTYYEVLDDARVFAADGTVHYEVLSEAGGTVRKIASFPSSYLMSPRKWMLEHFKGTPQGEAIERIWPLGKRYTRFRGITTSWDMQIDKDVWCFNIDTGFGHKVLVEEVFPFLKHKVKKMTELGVGGGGISALLAQTFPDAELSITDISSYALSTTLLNLIANHPDGPAYLEHVRKYWGKGIEGLSEGQDFVFLNPPYIPVAPFEPGAHNDPYRGTGFIRELIKDGWKKLNPDNPEAAIYINLSSLAMKDVQQYLKEFGDKIEFEPVGSSLKVPLKIRWMSEAWKQWLWKENGGLERIENPTPDQEEYWHTLQVYRIRRKVEAPQPKRVAIIGGTFDPFHLAHQKMVQDVRAELGVDEVIVVPTNVSPHKLGKFAAPKEIRYKMAQAAVAGIPWAKVSDFDMNRPGPSYSIDLVRDIEAKYAPGSRFFFVIGEDQIGALDTWKNIDELKEKVSFVAYTRTGKGAVNARVPVQVIERPAIELSATDIRSRVAVGRPITGFVPLEVAEIIEKEGLYQPEQIFTESSDAPILSLKGEALKYDKPFAVVTDAHGTLLAPTWKKGIAHAWFLLTGQGMEAGLAWVEQKIVQQMIDTTRDVTFDEVLSTMGRELSLMDISRTKDEIVEALKVSRSLFEAETRAEAMPGAVEGLRALKALGLPVRVVTGNDSDLVYRQLVHAGFGDIIASDGVFGKDRQEAVRPIEGKEYTIRENMIHQIMETMPERRMIYLDDWIEGARVSKDLDAIFMGAPQGAGLEQKRNYNRLRSEGADLMVTGEAGWKRLVSLVKVLDQRRERRTHEMVERTARVAMVQMNPVVGDLDGNFNKMGDGIARAKAQGVDVVVFPEMSMTGYPAEDHLKEREFVDQNKALVALLVRQTRGITAVVGFADVDRWGLVYNAVAILSDGEVKGIYRKNALPNYGVFDDKRTTKPGKGIGLYDFDGNELHREVFDLNGLLLAFNVCEDIWVNPDGEKDTDGRGIQEPMDHEITASYMAQAAKGARLIINTSASPYRTGVFDTRTNLVRKRAQETNATIVYVNTVGGQDEVVYDGNSMVVASDGTVLARGKPFAEDFVVLDLDVKTEHWTAEERKAAVTLIKHVADEDKPELALVPEVASPDDIKALYEAIKLGIRDYFHKNKVFKAAIFGDSGGIDSGLMGAMLTDALGADKVRAASLPSKHNSTETKSDARTLADNLGISFEEVPIQAAYEEIVKMLRGDRDFQKATGVTLENIQARLRMIFLMARANENGWLLFATSNKSESALGWFTIYGDSSGGFTPFKDLSKTDIFRLARYMNEQVFKREVIPWSIINRPPSPELADNQKTSDTIPDYVTITDPILRLMIEKSLSAPEIQQVLGIPLPVVRRAQRMLKYAEWKRRQTPPGIKVTGRAFGRDRRMPITDGYDPERVQVFIDQKSAASDDAAMGTAPLTRLFGQKRTIELDSDKGPVRMELSEFGDKEMSTVLLNPEAVQGARVTLTHYLDSDDDVLQAILIMSHLRQYGVAGIDLRVKAQKPLSLSVDEDSGDAFLLTALSYYADKIQYLDDKDQLQDVKNVVPFPQVEKKDLPLKVNRLLYLDHEFKPSAERAVRMLSPDARADNITVQNRYGLRFVRLPEGLKGQNVVLYHSTESGSQIISLLMTLVALRREGVSSISLVNSYLGYARQDKNFLAGGAVHAATILQIINRLVDHHFVINAHYGKASGIVKLQQHEGTEIYNLNGFVPMAEFMASEIIGKITGVKNLRELSWDDARKLGPQIEREFAEHPILIVGPDKGSKIYSQEAAHELKRLVKVAYGADVAVHVGYLPKERDRRTGVIKRNETPLVLDIESDQPLDKLGERPIQEAWAFILDDMTDTGGTLLSATYILVKKLGLPWRKVFAGVVHGVLSQKLVPFETGLTQDEIQNVAEGTLPRAEFIDETKGRMPPVLMAAMQTLLLPKGKSFRQVPMDDLVGHVVKKTIGETMPAVEKSEMGLGMGDAAQTNVNMQLLVDVLSDDGLPFWELPHEQYAAYLSRFAANHGYPLRDLVHPPSWTHPSVIKYARRTDAPDNWAQPDLDDPSLTPEQRQALLDQVTQDIMRWAPDTVFVNGRPRNDLLTGMKGRGKLGNYGKNPAGDPVILRWNADGELEVLLIERKDGTGWGFPGGFAKWGEERAIGYTETREGIEETMKESPFAVDLRGGKVIYDGKAFSSRDTDDAWVVTRASAALISYEASTKLKIKASDDALEAGWVKVDRNVLKILVDVHPQILKNAVRSVVSGELQVNDALVVPREALLKDVSGIKYEPDVRDGSPRTVDDIVKSVFGRLDRTFSAPEQETTFYHRIRRGWDKLEALMSSEPDAFQKTDVFEKAGRHQLSAESLRALSRLTHEVETRYHKLLRPVLAFLDIGKVEAFRSKPEYKGLNFANHPLAGAAILEHMGLFQDMGLSVEEQQMALAQVREHGFLGQSKRGEVTNEVFKGILELAIEKKDLDILKFYFVANVIDTALVREDLFTEELFQWFYHKYEELRGIAQQAIASGESVEQVLVAAAERIESAPEAQREYVLDRLSAIWTDVTRDEIERAVDNLFKYRSSGEKQQFISFLARQKGSLSFWYPEVALASLSMDQRLILLALVMQKVAVASREATGPVDVSFYQLANELGRRDDQLLSEENRKYVFEGLLLAYGGYRNLHHELKDADRVLAKAGISCRVEPESGAVYVEFDSLAPAGLSKDDLLQRAVEIDAVVQLVTPEDPLRFVKRSGVSGAGRVGVLPASFDPIQRSHLKIIETAAGRADIDELVIVLSKDYVLSDEFGEPMATRILLLEQALKGMANGQKISIAVSNTGRFVELPSLLRRSYQTSTLDFFMGFDNFEQMINEKLAVSSRDELKAFLRTNKVTVIPRWYYKSNDIRRLMTEQGLLEFLPSITSGISMSREFRFHAATEVKRRLRDGLSASEMVPLDIVRIVKALGLYSRTAMPDLKTVRNPVKITFVNLTSPRHKVLVEPLGMNALIGDLRRQFGEDVKVSAIDTQFGLPVEQAFEQLREAKPDIIGLSAQLESHETLAILLDLLERESWVKERNVKVVLGGNLPTNEHLGFLQKYPFVIVIRGEGELPMREMVRFVRGDVGVDTVPAASYYKGGRIVENDGTPISADQLGMPARDDLQTIMEHHADVQIRTSEGCGWGACTFCSKDPFRAHKWEPLPDEVVLDDLEFVYRSGARHVKLSDWEFFGGGKDTMRGIRRARRLSDEMIKRGIKLSIAFSGRADSIFSERDTDAERQEKIETLKVMYQAGFTSIFLGLESGSQDQLNGYGKGTTVHENEEAVRILRELGFKIMVGFIPLWPFSTKEQILEDIRFLRRNNLFIEVSYPINRMRVQPGTEMYKRVQEAGLLGPRDPRLYYFAVRYADPDVEKIAATVKKYPAEVGSFFYYIKYQYLTKDLMNLPEEEYEREVLRGYYDRYNRLEVDFLEALVMNIGSTEAYEQAVQTFRLKRFELVREAEKDILSGRILDRENFLADELVKMRPVMDEVLGKGTEAGSDASMLDVGQNFIGRKGGIDFDPAMMDLQIKRDNNGIPLPSYKQHVATIKIDAFTPVIISIAPVNVAELLVR